MRLVSLTVLVLLQFFNVDRVYGIRISQEKCKEHDKPALPIDQYSEDDVLKEFPFMALILQSNKEKFYNGILVSEKYVLTVAEVDFREAVVRLGRLTQIRDTEEIHDHLQWFQVAREVVHPWYGIDLTFNLKLLELDGPAEFNHFVQPACLAQPESHISHEPSVLGWGVAANGNSIKLHNITMYPSENSECGDIFRMSDRTYPFMKHINDEMIICGLADNDGRDLCHVYGGASLVNSNRSMDDYGQVVGLAVDRLQYMLPAVFIRISENLDWIESVVWAGQITLTAKIIIICLATVVIVAIIIAVVVCLLKRRAAKSDSSMHTPLATK